MSDNWFDAAIRPSDPDPEFVRRFRQQLTTEWEYPTMDAVQPISTRPDGPNRTPMYLAAAAAVVLVIGGIAIAASGDDGSVVSDQPGVTTGETTPAVPTVPGPSEPVVAPPLESTPQVETTDPVTETTVPPTTMPPTTVPPTTVPVTTLPIDALGGYELSAVPVAPELPGMSDPITDPLPDGVYWSWEYQTEGDTVRFTLVQQFFGDACRAQFGDSEDVCLSDAETLATPSAEITMTTDQATASVVQQIPDGGFTWYRVSADEFLRLVAGESPAADAPAGFDFVPFGVIVTVSDGRVVAADQVFTS